MPDLLAKTLVEQNVVDAAAIEEALKRQVVHGGTLDTNLLEAGAVSELELLRVLGEAFSLPTAERADIDSIPAHIPRLFPLVFAETYHLVPYRLVGQNLGVLASRPGDGTLFRRIQERLQMHVKPTLTTEVRLHYAMFRLYGTELLPRFRELLIELDGEDVLSKSGDAAAPTSHMLTWGLPTGRVEPPKTARQKRQPIRVDGLLDRLAAANDRDTIINILMEVVLSTFEFAAIFLVQGSSVNGWRGATPEETGRIARISMPIELPSVFQTIYATNGHYLGPLPANSVNTKLVEDLGRSPPRTAFLAPILVGGKIAGIIYADNGARGVPSKRVSTLLLLSHRAGQCLEGLIRRRKAGEVLGEPPPADETSAGEEHIMLEDGDFEPIVDPPQVFDDAPPPAAPEGLEQVVTAPPPAAPPAAAAEATAEDDIDIEVDADVPDDIRLAKDDIRVEEPAALPDPEVEPIDEDDEEEEDVGNDPWESVSLDELDTSQVTGDFEQDTSPNAATAAFEHGVEASAATGVAAEVETAEEPEEKYVAFADIDGETPEDSVGGWEDVFVETLGTDRADQETPTAEKTERAPPAVTWDDVIAEAENAPPLTAAPPGGPIEVAGTVVDEKEILLDSLQAADAEVWKTAIDKLALLGSSLDEELKTGFPGTIRLDPFAPRSKLPPFSQCSGLTALLATRGPNAAAVALPFLESNDRVKRFFAIYFLYAVRYPAALELLARRLYDAEPRNRFLAADALRTNRQEAGYRRIIQGLRDHLKVPVFEAQVATVQVLGQLRDPSAVPSLIPLVISPRQALARASASALTVICGQSFGTEVARWAEWWQQHFNKPREAWLVEGMRHPDANIRRIAAREFQLLTGRSAPTDSGVTPEAPEQRAQA